MGIIQLFEVEAIKLFIDLLLLPKPIDECPLELATVLGMMTPAGVA